MKVIILDLLMVQKYISSKQDSERKKNQMCLGNLSRDFSVNNKKKIRLNVRVYNFSFDHGAFDISGIRDIHKYLMKKHDIK